MAVDGTTPGGTESTAGNVYMDAVKEEIEAWRRYAIIPVNSVAGTNTITGTPRIPLAAYADGVKARIVPVNATTGSPVTLNLGGLGAKNVLDHDGNAIGAGSMLAGSAYILEFFTADDAFRVMTGDALFSSASAPDVQEFAISGTWTKPAGYGADSPVHVELVSGGASGGQRTGQGTVSGGGGGGYFDFWCLLGDLDATEDATVGAGGASVAVSGNGNAGGSSSFTVGAKTVSVAGATGGGNDSSGSASVAGGNAGRPNEALVLAGTLSDQFWAIGTSADTTVRSGLNGGAGGQVTSSTSGMAAGGNAVRGGAGGGPSHHGSGGVRDGGVSRTHGNGGAGGSNTGGNGGAGTAPGGGGGGAVQGGTSGAGAAGMVRVTTYPIPV